MKLSYVLWLWYDYHVELYDRGLPGAIPAPDDKSSVYVPFYAPSSISSAGNAIKLLRTIREIAEYYNIDHEEMEREKHARRKITASKRREDYECLLEFEPIEFDLIEKYMRNIQRKDEKESDFYETFSPEDV